ncbi:unnamed protein product [Chironomus riparius]|uniref:Uncharacterized protein n=1 Tax=Chironomus riparius TaxID=315576 RepID=A0A9P0NDC5_9DIPT|nr:unnamed protein product [Chironomus riparius]
MGGFEQRQWTPTKKRGLIAAEMHNPGPACVQLPQLLGTKILDSKKSAAPAFSFGSRHQNNTRTIGPGPSAYNIVGLAAKGKDTPPQISLQSRAKSTKIIETPGAGDYHIEKSDKYIVSSAPKYTFGVKKYSGLSNSGETPAPNFYDTDKSKLDNTPSYTFGVKTNVKQEYVTPGPNVYDVDKHDNTPSYTFGVKTNIQKDNGVPGVGTYDSEKFSLDHTPAYTFGVKTNIKQEYVTPGPNVYDVDKHDNTPSYSFGVKTNIQKDNGTPGVGTYNTENVSFDHTPAFSFGIKPNPLKMPILPGPCDYQPEKLRQFTGPSYSFGIKVNPNDRPECETRSVTPTSELAEKQIDIDQEFAKELVVTRTKTKTHKIAHKRA